MIFSRIWPCLWLSVWLSAATESPGIRILANAARVQDKLQKYSTAGTVIEPATSSVHMKK